VRNLEFKARLEDPKAAMSRARGLGAELWGDLRQTDTYYAVPSGRLKLRETPSFPAQLIFYQRDESAESDRISEYETAHSPEGAALRELLSHALGVLAVVRKRRTLLLLDTTRLHFDKVEGLGDFLEIEVPVKDSEEAAARERFESLLIGLGFSAADSIRASYLDLILASQEKPGDETKT
jgi:predicted adenylyl cyclase CyaB